MRHIFKPKLFDLEPKEARLICENEIHIRHASILELLCSVFELVKHPVPTVTIKLRTQTIRISNIRQKLNNSSNADIEI